MIKNACALVAALALLPMPGFAAQSQTADPGMAGTLITVPAGTQIPVHVVGTVSSATAKAGDTFQIQAAKDVIVNGMVVVRGGAGGEGSITEVDSAGGNGHSGALALTFQYIYSVDGGRIRLLDAPQKQQEDDRKGASSTATIVGFATLGLGGLFAHNFAHGRQKTLDENTTINAFVADSVHVKAIDRAEDPHYDH